MTRVLVVEDDRSLLALIQDHLELCGLWVATAGSVAEARQRIHSEPFEVVVLDRRLPDGSGLDLLTELADFMSDAHVIVASADGSEGDRVRALEDGADDYLTKPYSVRELGARIEAVARRQARVQRRIGSPASRQWIWQAGPEGIFTYCSPGVRDLLGYDPSELIGRRALDLVAPEDRSLVRAIQDVAAGTSTGWERAEARWLHANGHVVRLVGSAEPLVDGGGHLVGYRGIRYWAEEADELLLARRQRIRGILTDRRYTIALQPIIDVVTGEWVGAEALCRFQEGSPEHVFAEAAHLDLGEEVEAAAMQSALDLLAEIPPAQYVAVNLSPFALSHPTVLDVLDAHRRDMARIVVELTEHVSINDYEKVFDVLTPYREAGLRVAIDDAGGGYASFLHIVNLRPDIIKLDRNLVAGIGTDPAKRAVAHAIRDLAAELGAAAVAEGVESAVDSRAAAEHGLPLQQGYVIARPTADPAEWARWRVGGWPRLR
jgi:PAS domain S-box-containing protein